MCKDREQKLVDMMYQIAFTVKERNDYFKDKSTPEIAEWVTGQLAGCGFPTTPVGALWGMLINIDNEKQ